MIFKTNPDQMRRIPGIMTEMIRLGVDQFLVFEISKIAVYDQGAYDLMKMYIDFVDERSDILEDISLTIKDYKNEETSQKEAP